MAFKVSMKKNSNVKLVVRGLITTILILFVGGFLIMTLANVMKGSCSPFYTGLQLIGWKVGNETQAAGVTLWDGCAGSNQILYDTSGVGVLTIVGLLALAGVVMQFVDISF